MHKLGCIIIIYLIIYLFYILENDCRGLLIINLSENWVPALWRNARGIGAAAASRCLISHIQQGWMEGSFKKKSRALGTLTFQDSMYLK